ncbi:hypothetical protein V3W47_09895 [Deinococcus sp. YIM 134068]|uniref:hypothetical protein n=1 Tax=Deinococcus lichenicola TaxID=3118910 RepID=UPI002F94B099
MATPLNPYVWELFKFSEEGQLCLEYLSNLDRYPTCAQLFSELHGVEEYVLAHLSAEGKPEWEDAATHPDNVAFVQRVQRFAASKSADTLARRQELLAALVNGAVPLTDDEDSDCLDADTALLAVEYVSLGLHLAHPDFFLPYAFGNRFDLFGRIAEAFDILLPPVPSKRDKLARWLYYGQMCGALREFRESHPLSVPEMLAFLNYFATGFVLAEQEKELPPPRRAWLLLGAGEKDGDFGWLESADANSQSHWQGNESMQRGDICVMYVRSPHSSVHSIWRAVEDGYADPFFHYKHAVQIGQPVRVPRLTFADMNADPLLSANKYMRANLQGASGKHLSRTEYERLLALLAERGLDLTTIPRLPAADLADLEQLENERDVELRLIEPLLRRLGYREQDWIRQLPVRMGRGERVYPDYALGVTGQAPELRAHALVEAKYRLSTEREWRGAFLQAKSYGLRLGAECIAVAAAESLRVFRRSRDDFQFERGQSYSWPEVMTDTTLLELERVFRGGRSRRVS